MEESVVQNGLMPEMPLGWQSWDIHQKSDGNVQDWGLPEKAGRDMWWILWQQNDSVTHKWVVTFMEDANISGQTYSSEWYDEHAILVTWWTITISDATITKVGDVDGDNADFYWTNAAVIAIDGVLELNNDNISTEWSYSNAVFAYGDGEIIISDSVIITQDDNSWWIMVTWWWTITANNVIVTTNWNSSAAIRSDRWWGTINVNWGSYTSNGVWSPAIYSTADIIVENAQLTATQSEWAIVEWKNSVKIINSTLMDFNTTLHWHSATYKNIFLYQSMSWDADEWTASFTAKDSKIITNNGDTIYVTNTRAEILLQNNEISNTNWDFLRIEAAARWKQGSNWWDVNLSLVNQGVEWDIVVDDISSLTMNLTEWSNFVWSINSENESQNIVIKLDDSSTWTLVSDSYISKIQSEATWYSNINLNGYTLYVWWDAVEFTDWLSQEETWMATVELVKDEWSSTTDIVLWWVGILAVIVALWIGVSIYLKK